MAAVGDPSVQRRRLRTALRKAREEARLTQREAAAALEWSLSKLIRIEAGAQGLSVTDLKAMLDLYGVTAEDRVAALSAAARGSRGQPWWSSYRDIVSQQFARYLDHEANAASFRIFHPLLVPGLLHTEEYAAEILGVHPEPERAPRIQDLREERQDRLFARSDLEFAFILDEEALHRWIGGPLLMRRQLQHLRDMAERPDVSIQIVPFSAGAHPGLRGPFILLRLSETDDEVLFLESASGDQLIRDDPELIAKYATYFEKLRELALPHEQGEALLKDLIERLHLAGERAADDSPPG